MLISAYLLPSLTIRALHPHCQVVAAADLGGCSAALLFDRATTTAAAARQLRLDNRKPAAARALEGPTQTAALLLLRGVRCVVATTTATTTWANAQLLGGVLKGISGEGRGVGAAVAAAAVSTLPCYEIRAVREAGLVVWGLPHAAAPDAGGGGGEGGRRGGGGGRTAGGAAAAGAGVKK
jgi:hypothetical protein